MAQSPPDAMRKSLLDKVERLSPLELAVLQVLAVAGEPASNGTVFEICTKAGLNLRDETDDTLLRSLAPQLRRLRNLQLINENNLVNELIVEVIARRLFADKQTSVVPPAAAEKPEKPFPNRTGAKSRAPKPVSLPMPIPRLGLWLARFKPFCPSPPRSIT